ncbi:MAG: glycosyltransferase [Geobacteraceae bacterium]|nr:glycosyltransferase [Geobacteraceae bacterium]
MKIRFLEAPPLNVRNGNVVTCERWRAFFESLGHRVESFSAEGDGRCDLLVVFNAYKNRQAVRDARKNGTAGRIAICLTGTDLYRDLQNDSGARDVLYLADQLVVLQSKGIFALPPDLHCRTMVIFQSAVAPKVEVTREEAIFDVCGIAHLRAVKDPLLAASAARLLPPDSRIRILHVGKALSSEYARAAAQEVAENPRFHWFGEQSGERTAEILLGSRLLVMSSLFEGGANVVSEAVVCSIPVIGTDIPCMQGLLGDEYPGLFPVGDARRLAQLLYRAETDRRYYDELVAWCRRELYKFAPERERESLKILVERVFSWNHSTCREVLARLQQK